jgi:hypothetical protein
LVMVLQTSVAQTIHILYQVPWIVSALLGSEQAQSRDQIVSFEEW